MAQDGTVASLAALDERRREQAMARFAVLRPHLEEGVPLARAASHAGIPVRTAERWLARYHKHGVTGLARPKRCDDGARRLPAGLVAHGRGHGAEAATVVRRRHPPPGQRRRQGPGLARSILRHCARDRRRPRPGHGDAGPGRVGCVPGPLRADPPPPCRGAQCALAGGPHPARPAHPGRGQQASPAVVDHGARRSLPGRRWLHAVFFGAPSALNTSLALRHAIWRKADPAWPVCGIPDALYVDHGSDFTSQHLDQVSAALRMQVIVLRRLPARRVGARSSACSARSTPSCCRNCPGIPRGRQAGHPAASCRLAELDRTVGAYIAGTYHGRLARRDRPRIRSTPGEVRSFLPRLPDSLEELDLLLVLHARPRMVRRDGIRFQGLRYASPDAGRLRSRGCHPALRPARPVRGTGVSPRPIPVPGGERGARGSRGHAQGHRGGSARSPPGHCVPTSTNGSRGWRTTCLPTPIPRVPRQAKQPARPARTRLRIYEEDGP